MRLTSILLSALLLSYFSIQAHADGSGEPGDIAVPSISVPNMDVPAPLISAPNMDMPAPNPKPLGKPSKNPNQAFNKTGNVSSNQTQVTQIQQKPKSMNVSGKWSIMFNDNPDRSLVLNLWSEASGNIIMGYGTLIEAGASNSVTASGSASAQELKLTAKLADSDYTKQKNKECDLDLFMVNSTLSGTYVLKSGGQFLGKGNVTAAKE